MRCKQLVVVLMFALAAMVVLQGCAHKDPWTKGDTIGQVLVTTSIVADMYTTSQFQHHNNVVETNYVAVRLLGREPSTGDVILYGATLSVSYWLISRALPKKWRPYFQGATGAAHAIAAYKNHNLLQEPQRICEEELCPQRR